MVGNFMRLLFLRQRRHTNNAVQTRRLGAPINRNTPRNKHSLTGAPQPTTDQVVSSRPQTLRSSANTSASNGESPSSGNVPNEAGRLISEDTNARAQITASTRDHRLSQASLALFFNSGGDSRTRASASILRNCIDSSENLVLFFLIQACLRENRCVFPFCPWAWIAVRRAKTSSLHPLQAGNHRNRATLAPALPFFGHQWKRPPRSCHEEIR